MVFEDKEDSHIVNYNENDGFLFGWLKDSFSEDKFFPVYFDSLCFQIDWDFLLFFFLAEIILEEVTVLSFDFGGVSIHGHFSVDDSLVVYLFVEELLLCFLAVVGSCSDEFVDSLDSFVELLADFVMVFGFLLWRDFVLDVGYDVGVDSIILCWTSVVNVLD